MADSLEDIVPEVRVEGADAAAAALRNIGEVGAEAFGKIADAAASGDFTALASLIGGELAGSFTKASETILEMVHSAAEAVETLSNLAAVAGESTGQFQGLQEAFASVGISTQGFERSMGRLAQTINSSWASIQESVRTASDEETSAQLGMQEAALNTSKAYQSLAETMQKVSDTAVTDQNNIADAKNNLLKAQNAQLKGQGVDTSASDKQIQLQEQANAVVKARNALYEANQKAANDEAEEVNKIKEAQLAVQKAILAQAEAAEKAHEVDLKNIPEIAKQIDNVAKGYEKWTDNQNLAEVSAENLAKAVIKAASPGGDKKPEVMDVLNELSQLFDKTADHAIDMGTKIEIVTRLMGAGFRAGQASAAQLLAVLEEGPEKLKALQEATANSPFAVNKQDEENLKDLNAAWAELGITVGMVEEKFAAFAAPTVTAVINGIKAAIEGVGEAMAKVGEWIDQAFGQGASTKIAQFAAGFAVIFPAVMAIVVVLGSVIGVVAAIASGVGVFLAAFAAAFLVVETFVQLWPKVQAAVAGFVSWFESTWLGKIITGIDQATEKLRVFLGLAKEKTADEGGPKATTSSGQQVTNATQKSVDAGNLPVNQGGIQVLSTAADKQTEAAGTQSEAADKTSTAADSLNQAGQSLSSAAQALAAAAQQAPGAQPAQSPDGKAGGGHIRGPGGPTDDRAGLFRLSDNEYVVKAAAVQHYGVGLFDALNNLAVGGFATGGRVGGVSVPSGSGPAHGGSSILNLTIDGQHFNGLRAPNDVAAKLKMHAVSRQSTAAGRNPSWMR